MHRASNKALLAIHKHTALLRINSRGLFRFRLRFALLFADWTLVVEQAVSKRRLLRHFVPRNDGMHKASAVIASKDKSIIASEARHSSRYVIASEAKQSRFACGLI